MAAWEDDDILDTLRRLFEGVMDPFVRVVGRRNGCAAPSIYESSGTGTGTMGLESHFSQSQSHPRGPGVGLSESISSALRDRDMSHHVGCGAGRDGRGFPPRTPTRALPWTHPAGGFRSPRGPLRGDMRMCGRHVAPHILALTLMELPAELIDAIVCDVKRKDDLRSLCLAASCFRFPCQQRLFGTLSISSWEGRRGTSYARAAVQFERYPHLAALVGELRVSLKNPRAYHSPYTSAHDSDHDAARLATLFARFTGVYSLTISGDDGAWFTMAAINRAFADWLVLIPPGTLRKVRFSHIWVVPRRIIRSVFRALAPHSHVDFDVVTIEDIACDDHPPYTTHSCEFEFRDCLRMDALAQPEFLPSMRALRKLVVPVNDRLGFSEALRICQAAAGNLEHLHLRVTRATVLGYDNPQTIALPQCLSALSQVTLTFFSLDYELQLDKHFTWVFTTIVAPLLQRSVTPALTTFALPVAIYEELAQTMDHLIEVLRDETAAVCLCLLDSILTGRDIRLVLVLHVRNSQQVSGDERKTLVQELGERLPGLAEKCLLDMVLAPFKALD
ncbi:hypothetical protein MIND_00403900 [Mycena indigotica]|uniref:F-box domain-containing protein n=1 Tax=Mycena indigotica TaxID=2126181 RepID=A0A8H6WF95_9AGAR|nr:uncharacterized protein MIND_00403900 [Mycena indigotica]KAF7310299.1 hypothetical protein MIND_00403900 [Mycena indigotica]